MYDMELLEYLFKLLTSQTDINYYVLKNLELTSLTPSTSNFNGVQTGLV